MLKNYQNEEIDTNQPAVPEAVSVALTELGSEADKQSLIQDEASPFFSTAHFDGHQSVLLRASRIGELTRDELAEVVQDAWLSRASARRATAWLLA